MADPTPGCPPDSGNQLLEPTGDRVYAAGDALAIAWLGTADPAPNATEVWTLTLEQQGGQGLTRDIAANHTFTFGFANATEAWTRYPGAAAAGCSSSSSSSSSRTLMNYTYALPRDLGAAKFAVVVAARNGSQDPGTTSAAFAVVAPDGGLEEEVVQWAELGVIVFLGLVAGALTLWVARLRRWKLRRKARGEVVNVNLDLRR
ncbi:hypothetical protein F4780DRAFT_265598 [Xylariomycetidae sp. FL0641]|nr:hypothetical protein F4780DRAFT_265598 [Xylariomycetidae sp. FL0641]